MNDQNEIPHIIEKHKYTYKNYVIILLGHLLIHRMNII